MKGARNILRFLVDAHQRGEAAALATITAITGSSPRALGTQMAITKSGAYVGSFSGGCTEAAIVGEAQRVLASGRGELVRLGSGSRLIDIRLPCGGAIDFLVSPNPDPETITMAYERLTRRIPVSLEISSSGLIALAAEEIERSGWAGDRFLVRHDPDLRIIIIGEDAEALALDRLARAYGAETVILCHSDEQGEALAASAASIIRVRAGEVPSTIKVDHETAIVFLLHDHERETDLLIWALRNDPLFVGAMGSKRTHAGRLAALRARGLSEQDCAGIVAPVGLIPATRDPDTLALSVLSQIAKVQASARVAEASFASPGYKHQLSG